MQLVGGILYKRSIAIRIANNQRKLDKEKESEKGEEETEGTEDSEPMATAMRYGFDEDLDEFADEGIASVDETDEEMGDDEEHYEQLQHIAATVCTVPKNNY